MTLLLMALLRDLGTKLETDLNIHPTTEMQKVGDTGDISLLFLPDPGVSGVRSMGPGLSNSVQILCETLLM